MRAPNQSSVPRASLPGAFVATASAFVRRRTGLVFSQSRRESFEAALVKGMRFARVTDPELYLARLGTELALFDELIGEITVGETYFFREPERFALLRREIIPALLEGRPQTRALRCWSAGCASGEEAYSLAIVLKELGLLGSAHIVGSDICRTALVRARRARYRRWSLRGVSEQLVHTYFTAREDWFDLAPNIRAGVEFRYLNLAEDVYPSVPTGIWGMDLILCRNMLIYFDADTVVQVARRLLAALADGGWLLLGASDPALGDIVPVEVVVTDAGLAYRHRRQASPSSRPVQVAPLVPADPAPFTLHRASRPVSVSENSPPTPVSSPVPASPPTPAEDAADAAWLYAARDYARAAELAERSLGQGDGDPARWVLLVRALANRGDLAAAGRACAQALDRHPSAAELIYLHAVLLSEGRRHAEAATAARRALYLDRTLVVAHLALGNALLRAGDVPGARRAFRNAAGLLGSIPPADIVPASDGEPAGRLLEMARVQQELLGRAG